MSEIFLWPSYRKEGEIIITRFNEPKQAIMKRWKGEGGFCLKCNKVK
jgi:hypothetical protein